MSAKEEINLVTGARNQDHVTSADDGSLHAAFYGRGQYVLYGFGYTLVNANLIRVSEGDALVNGRHIRIDHGYATELQLTNGSQGMNRADLVVLTYQKVSATVEKAYIEVLTGTSSAGTPAVPAYTSGDILAGDTMVQMPLYRINYTGVSTPTVTKVFENPRGSIADMLQNIIYPPVGWIEENINGVNPSTRYPGTTWELYGKGRVAVCIDTSDADFNTVGKTAGTKTVTLAIGNIPSHTHQVGAHVHAIGLHKHSVNAQTTTADQNGTHSHLGYYTQDAASGSAKTRYSPKGSGTTESSNALTASAGAHYHNVSIPAHDTNNSTSGNTGNNTAFNSGATGSGNAVNNLQPYVVVYRWVRTA